jgi:DNA-binding response OmpR family regulator
MVTSDGVRTLPGSILLIGGDGDLARAITKLLTDEGLDVVHTTTAPEAVARGRELRPRAVVLDLQGLDDGSRVVADLRREHALADATLLVYSADDVAPERRADLALGRTVFLTRARVGPEELRERLVGLLDGTTGRHEGFARG